MIYTRYTLETKDGNNKKLEGLLHSIRSLGIIREDQFIMQSLLLGMQEEIAKKYDFTKGDGLLLSFYKPEFVKKNKRALELFEVGATRLKPYNSKVLRLDIDKSTLQKLEYISQYEDDYVLIIEVPYTTEVEFRDKLSGLEDYSPVYPVDQGVALQLLLTEVQLGEATSNRVLKNDHTKVVVDALVSVLATNSATAMHPSVCLSILSDLWGAKNERDHASTTIAIELINVLRELQWDSPVDTIIPLVITEYLKRTELTLQLDEKTTDVYFNTIKNYIEKAYSTDNLLLGATMYLYDVNTYFKSTRDPLHMWTTKRHVLIPFTQGILGVVREDYLVESVAIVIDRIKGLDLKVNA